MARTLLRGVPKAGVTVVVLMARERRAQVAGLLLDAGWSGQVPAVVVQRASLPDQTLWQGTLAALADPRSSAHLAADAASLLVFGPTVALAGTLSAALAQAA